MDQPLNRSKRRKKAPRKLIIIADKQCTEEDVGTKDVGKDKTELSYQRDSSSCSHYDNLASAANEASPTLASGRQQPASSQHFSSALSVLNRKVKSPGSYRQPQDCQTAAVQVLTSLSPNNYASEDVVSELNDPLANKSKNYKSCSAEDVQPEGCRIASRSEPHLPTNDQQDRRISSQNESILDILNSEIETLTRNPPRQNNEDSSPNETPISHNNKIAARKSHVPPVNKQSSKPMSSTKKRWSQECLTTSKKVPLIPKGDIVMQAGTFLLSNALLNDPHDKLLRKLLAKPGRGKVENLSERSNVAFKQHHQARDKEEQLEFDAAEGPLDCEGVSPKPTEDENHEPPKPTTVIYFKSEPVSDDEDCDNYTNKKPRLDRLLVQNENDALACQNRDLASKITEEDFNPEEVVMKEKGKGEEAEDEMVSETEIREGALVRINCERLRLNSSSVLESVEALNKSRNESNQRNHTKIRNVNKFAAKDTRHSHENTNLNNRQKGSIIVDLPEFKSEKIPDEEVMTVKKKRIENVKKNQLSHEGTKINIEDVTSEIKIEAESGDEDAMSLENDFREEEENVTLPEVKTEIESGNQLINSVSNTQDSEEAAINVLAAVKTEVESESEDMIDFEVDDETEWREEISAFGIKIEDHSEDEDRMNIANYSGGTSDNALNSLLDSASASEFEFGTRLGMGRRNVNSESLTEGLIVQYNEGGSKIIGNSSGKGKDSYKRKYRKFEMDTNDESKSYVASLICKPILKEKSTGLPGFSFDTCERPKPYVVEKQCEPIVTQSRRTQTEIISALAHEPLMTFEQLTEEKLIYFTGVNKLKFSVLLGFCFSERGMPTWRSLSEEDQLLLALFRYKHNPRKEYLSVLFGIPVSIVTQILVNITKKFRLSNNVTLWSLKRNKCSLAVVLECRDFITRCLKSIFPQYRLDELDLIKF